MKRHLFLFFLFSFISLSSFSQRIQTPEEFLGYSLGQSFTPHYKVVEYFKYITSVAKNVKLVEYGKTNEGRPLLAAFVSSPENIRRLEDIRLNNLRLTGMEPGKGSVDFPVVVWLSYNVHGNEAVSTEASLKTIYDLVDPQNAKMKTLLQNTVVAIDPCMNPDGRERYVNFYNSTRNLIPDPDRNSREHTEPWPGGRTNHYYFDLNRDWAWQTQKETQQRMTLYNQWFPQIHVDFHEQSFNSPYYFAPAAAPLHENITPWQLEFQKSVGKNNAKYFDQNGWMYFTKERFDLLYPSYGDTYPTYNGAIGMTYEQGGGGSAGLSVITSSGDTLTLKDRINHHYTTGMSTLEIAANNQKKLLSEYNKFFSEGKNNPPGKYKTYVIKGENPEKLKILASLLERNKISFGYGSSRSSAKGFNYFSKKEETFKIGKGDMVISAYQPKAVLVKVLLEPETVVTDSNTYDITQWALPYAFGVNAYACTDKFLPAATQYSIPPITGSTIQNPYAFVGNWNSLVDVKFLAQLLKLNIKVRYTETPFEISGKSFNAGSLIISRTGNERLGTRLADTLRKIASASGVSLQAISSGFVDKGYDLGSGNVRYIKKPKVAVVMGDSISSLSFGEIWQFFEQQIKYPLTVIPDKNLNNTTLNNYDVLILPNGAVSSLVDDKLRGWVKGGGKVIAMEQAVSAFADKAGFGLKTIEPKGQDSTETGKDKIKEKDKLLYEDLKLFGNRERDPLKSSVPGSIYRLQLDNTHPLAFGYPNFYYTLKMDDQVYKYMKKGWNVGYLKRDNYISGIVGSEAKKKLVNGLIFGTEEIGKGSIVYLTDDPLFRGFWENGKLLFSNAVFMVGN